MSSCDIEPLRIKYPDKSVAEIAEIIGKEDDYFVIVCYKNSPYAEEYTNFGCCRDHQELWAYYTSPECIDTKEIYRRHKEE